MFQLLHRPDGRSSATSGDWLSHFESDPLPTARSLVPLIAALRVVRIGAWLGVAICLGLIFAAPAPSSAPEIQYAHPASHLTGASTCGCATKQGTIS